MTLSELLNGVTVTKIYQTTFGRMVTTHDLEILGVQHNSRAVRGGDVFVAIRGSAVDGHRFLADAVAQGAAAVVAEDDLALPDSFFMHTGTVKIVVPNAREALAIISANFYGCPSKRLVLVGVTGTNGKTTTTHVLKHILEHDHTTQQRRVGLIGTIEYVVGAHRIPATHTTPESLDLQRYLASMADEGCTHVVMEVSSHALEQQRVHGLHFAAAVFTNLTQDHLDYHHTMDTYFAAKRKLFRQLAPGGYAVVNIDDEWGRRIAAEASTACITYGTTGAATVKATEIESSIDSSRFLLCVGGHHVAVTAPLVGRFNVSNLLAGSAAAYALDIPLATIAESLADLPAVRGRFERVFSRRGWIAIIDYAHTPDALEQCLTTIHQVLPHNRTTKIITVFGAGGDRDKTKRPLMGAVVDRLSDVVIVTSDNPRTEDPETIMAEILAGIRKRSDVHAIVDRREAITTALSMAATHDVVLIAGKGHEEYQILGDARHYFSDREVVREFDAQTVD